MVTLAGTVAAAVLLLDRVTTVPPVGAAVLMTTVPVELLPPTTAVGLSDTEETLITGAVTVNVAVWVVPAGYVPEIVTGVEVLTALVVTEKVAVVDPAGTVTLDTVTWATAVLLLERLTAAPPVGAGPLSVTVPVDPAPPATVLGFSETDNKVTGGGVTVSVAV